MIEGVQTKNLSTFTDERGYFREIIRVTDDFFAEGFGQWSESLMYNDNQVTKAWHIHQIQTDWWYCSEGVIKAVLCDLRSIWHEFTNAKSLSNNSNYYYLSHPIDLELEFFEYILGGFSSPTVLKIPPGVAHGCKVLNGPAKLTYITSHVYNPDDEGRIPYDALGYDWLKGAEIK